MRDTAEKLIATLRDRQAAPATAGEPIDSKALFERALAAWVKRGDSERGGFGAAKGPRFPQQPVLSLLMADPGRNQIGLLTPALHAMAAGGPLHPLVGRLSRLAHEAA